MRALEPFVVRLEESFEEHGSCVALVEGTSSSLDKIQATSYSLDSTDVRCFFLVNVLHKLLAALLFLLVKILKLNVFLCL